MSKIYKNNSSGHPGVSFDSHANKWRAYITFNNKKIRLGNFSILQDAINARKAAEIALGNPEKYSLISFLGGDVSNLRDRFKLISLFCSFFGSNSHSFLLFAFNNWSSLDVSSISLRDIILCLNYVDVHAPSKFFLYISGLSLKIVDSNSTSLYRALLLFAQKLKNKFGNLL